MNHKKVHRFSRGQGLVEFALVIPIVLLLIVVFIDLGRAIYMQAALSNAAREGARYAIVHKETVNYYTDIENLIKHYSVALNPDAIITSITRVACFTGKTCINVQATYLYDPITPGLRSLLGGGAGIPLSVQTQMEIAPIGLP